MQIEVITLKRYIRSAEDAVEDVVEAKTTYYRVTVKDLLDYFKDKNVWMWAAFDNEGFDCLDIKSLYGSAIIGDTLFLCETNGVEIEVDGEQVDPETALEDYSISALSKYIKDVTDKAIEKNIDEYVIKGFKYDKWAPDLIKKYDFTDMVDDYLELTN